MRLARNLSCTHVETYDRWGDLVYWHSSSCQKCSLEHQANNMTTPVHEWPLPENDILIKLVIFELCPPQHFIGWRDITHMLSRRHSPEGTSEFQPSPAVILQDYPALSAYCSNKFPRITLASTAKSFLKSHYSSREVPCAESEVIKDHRLRYGMFDSASNVWVFNATFSSMDIRNECLSCLPQEILLLRGLLAGGILLHNLREKRWLVDYGFDPTRSMLAVPYRVKDSPAPRAEFGHPEMILLLTCLSYY